MVWSEKVNNLWESSSKDYQRNGLCGQHSISEIFPLTRRTLPEFLNTFHCLLLQFSRNKNLHILNIWKWCFKNRFIDSSTWPVKLCVLTQWDRQSYKHSCGWKLNTYIPTFSTLVNYSGLWSICLCLLLQENINQGYGTYHTLVGKS